MDGSCHGAHGLAQASRAALQLGDGIGMTTTVAGASFSPSSNRTGNAGGLTGIGLSLKACELGLSAATQLLPIAHPGHVTGLSGGMRRKNG